MNFYYNLFSGFKDDITDICQELTRFFIAGDTLWISLRKNNTLMARKSIITLFFLILSAASIHGAPYQFTNINTGNSNLSYDGISKIAQDSRGFIWIGTYKGLNRYDGNSFKVYEKEDLGLPSDFIFCISEDHDGNIWVGTDNGVSRYDYLKDSFEPLVQPSDKGTTVHNKVTLILVDEEGLVWMLVNDQGVFSYNTSTGELKMFPYSHFGDDIIGFRKMLRLGDGSFIMSCYHLNIFKSGPDFKNFGPFSKGNFYGDEIEGLFQKNPESIYVASSKNGICEADVRTGDVKKLFSLPANHTLTDAFYDGSSIWLSTTRGLWKYDTGSGESIFLTEEKEDRFSLSGSYISCSFVDKDKGIWVGTKDGGVNYCGTNQNRFVKEYRTDDGKLLSDAIISGFCEGNGHIYVSTEQFGLLDYNAGENRLAKVNDRRIPHTTVSPCFDDPYLWFGSLNGLFRMDTRTGKIKEYGVLQRTSGVNDPRVYLVYRTRSGNLIAGTTLGIFMYDRSEDKFVEVDAFDGIFTTGAAEDIDGCLWFSTYAKGVYKWDYKSGALPIHYSTSCDCGLTTDKISDIFIDSGNRPWVVGFSHGIFRYDSDRFEKIDRSTVPSLPSDVFFTMKEDSNRQFWLSSNAGLVQLNPDTYEVKVYSQIDGLLDNKLTHGACRLHNGDMLFGSDNGFIRFTPAELYSAQEIPSVVISGISIAGREEYLGENIDLMKRISLKKGQNSFCLQFSMLGIKMPASLRVQCRLENHDSDWNDVLSSKKIEYFNVPSGHYSLKIRAMSGMGNWEEAHVPVEIVVEPGFWGSARGITLIAFMLLGTMGSVVLIFDRRSRKKRAVQEARYRREKDEEMFQEKMNFFSHVIHEIKTPLTLIKTPLSSILAKEEMDSEARHDLKIMENSTDYLSRLVNELLDFVRIEKKGYTLQPEPLDLVERIRSLAFDYIDTAKNKNISLKYSPHANRAIVIADRSATDKILNNILINAVKHAESTIDIDLDISDRVVTIRFSNDGAVISEDMREEIFKPFVQYHSDGSGGVGIGLPLARNLARMHSGDLTLDTGCERTCFVLTMPVEQESGSLPESEDRMEPESTLPRLLIADNNKDLRDYLSAKLSEHYTIISVPNGDAALEAIQEQNVDFVLTDISMPGLNGLELCRKIRDNIEISHLPVIVISARSSVESKIQAMEAGADLYIEKPFDLEYLKSSIKNIMDRRLLMKNAFNKGITATDIDMFGLPKKDEEFFTKFDSLIRENLSNTELSVDWLSEHMNMSQSTLTRKIRKLLNTTPNYYIRSVRMSVAAGMLKNSHGNNISEICYAVGFSNLSYFAKCFKEQFGKIPSEYAGEQ